MDCIFTTFHFQGNITHKFDVLHDGVSIGTVKVAEKVNAQACLQIIDKSIYPETIVRSFKLGEFAVSSHYKNKN